MTCWHPPTKWWIVVLSDNLPEQPDWQTTTSRMAIVYSQRTCLTYDWAWRRIGVHQPLKPFTLKRSFLSVLLWPKTNTSPNQLPCQLMLQRDWLAVIYNRYYWLDFIRGFTGGAAPSLREVREGKRRSSFFRRRKRSTSANVGAKAALGILPRCIFYLHVEDANY